MEPKPVYTPNPPLTASEVASWETANKVLLPEAYRHFILTVGNGGSMPGSYCDFVVKPLNPDRIDPNLLESFPIPAAQFAQRIARLQTEGREHEALFPQLGSYWEEEGRFPGCLILGHYPSYDFVFLVVTGELRGTVWCAVDGGVPELDREWRPRDFLSWFEDTVLDLNR